MPYVVDIIPTDAELLWSLLLLPIVTALLCLLLPRARWILATATWVSAIQLGLAVETARRVLDKGSFSTAHEWIFVDAFSALHLLLLALVYLLSSLFAGVYFRQARGPHRFTSRVAKRFGGLWLGALGAMTLLLLSNNLGIMWFGMESTTLLTAFLISLYPDRLSLEAMWKYLIICSVGIAFAFMGTLLAASSLPHSDLVHANGLLWTYMVDPATRLDPALIQISFAFIIVGFGTKAGLAPVHSWLPDAHSQCPAPVSAMFSGFMLNAALYCIMRYVPLVHNTPDMDFAGNLLVVFGTLSILIAAAFIVFQTDVKRLLAYSSVEHIGIIALGYGLGPLGIFAALFHTVNHSICKSLAFFAAGRIGQRYGTYEMQAIKGVLRVDRLWGLGLLGSALAFIGVAPFAIFMSEYQILRAAVSQHSWTVLVLFLLGTGVIFVSILRHIIAMLYGSPVTSPPIKRASSVAAITIVTVSLGLLLLLGLWLPQPLWQLLREATLVISGV